VRLLSGQPFLRASVLERRRVCGKPTCRCAKGRKYRHRSLYLVVAEGQRQRQLYVPQDWEERVRQWVENHRTLKGLIRQVSELYWQKVQRREP
jgi:hypothetical protein